MPCPSLKHIQDNLAQLISIVFSYTRRLPWVVPTQLLLDIQENSRNQTHPILWIKRYPPPLKRMSSIATLLSFQPRDAYLTLKFKRPAYQYQQYQTECSLCLLELVPHNANIRHSEEFRQMALDSTASFTDTTCSLSYAGFSYWTILMHCFQWIVIDRHISIAFSLAAFWCFWYTTARSHIKCGVFVGCKQSSSLIRSQMYW